MYPRRMMLIGVILVIAAIAIFAFGLFMVGEEEDFVKNAARFDGGAADTARRGDLVIVEGKVSEKNKILVHDFVDAAKENNDAGTWGILEAYRQPVIADLARGEIILNSEYICDRAEGKNVLATDDRTLNNDPIRYIGLRRGDPITAVGTLSSLAPAALAVKHWYSGSVATYRDALTTNRRTGYIACPIIAVAGAALFLWGWKKR
jgi:hypothetical protein